MGAPDLRGTRGDGPGRAVGRSREGRRGDAARSPRGSDRFRSRRDDVRRDAGGHCAVVAPVRVSRILKFEALTVHVDDVDEMVRDAAIEAADALIAAITARGEANIMLATGNSQLAFLVELVQIPGVAWERVRAFHMDEYVGLPATHSAS